MLNKVPSICRKLPLTVWELGDFLAPSFEDMSPAQGGGNRPIFSKSRDWKPRLERLNYHLADLGTLVLWLTPLCREKVSQPPSSPGWVRDGGDSGGDTFTWGEGLMVV